jgi:hypothetical protein
LGAKQPTLQDPRWGGDTWAGKAVPHIVNFDYPVYGSHIDCAVGGQFRALDESEKAWVEVWKLATNYGWWATTILYVICVCDQKGYITGFTNFVFYALIFLPCIVFTVAGLMVKPRVSIPILIVNLQLLWYIIKWILAIVFIPVGIAWILIKLQQWFGK